MPNLLDRHDRKARREEAWLLEAYPGCREYMARVRRRVW